MMKWVVFTAVLLLAIGSGRAHAVKPDAEKQARGSFERAEVHFKEGKFAEALAEYQAGYAVAPLPGFLINIAQCHRRLGDLNQARAAYRKFIIVAPDSPYIHEVKAIIVELDDLLMINANNETPPPPTQVPSNPAPVAAEKSPSLTPSRQTETTNNLLVTAPATPVPEAASGTRWWFWGTVGAVVVVGAATALYLLQSPGTTTLHEGSIGTLRR
jgi:tetratricopeptide (TPR) repeat protein